MNSEIISNAEQFLSDENTRFEELVSAIEKSHHQAQVMNDEITSLKRESELLKGQLEEEKAQIEISKNKLISDARQEANEIIEQTQKDVAEILDSLRAEIKDAQSSSEKQEAQKSAREASRQLSEKSKENRENLRKQVSAAHKSKSLEAEDLVIGEYYHSDLYQIDGQILEVLPRENQAVLKSGVLTVNVPISSLSYISSDSQTQKEEFGKQSIEEKRQTQSIINERRNSVKTEIKLLGLVVSEALVKLDQFIDDIKSESCAGKGTGAKTSRT